MPGQPLAVSSGGVKVRALAVASSAFSMLAGLVYSLAVTRKLATISLGILNYVNAAVALGAVLQTVASFPLTRFTARDGKPSLALLEVYLLFTGLGVAISIAVIALMGSRLGSIYLEVAVLTGAISFSNYMQGYFGGILTVIDRVKLQYMNIASSAAKLILIAYIMASGWSLESVLVSTFLILATASIYGLYSSARRIIRLGSFRRYLREVVNASWVPLIGYAANNVRSLDSVLIAYLGGFIDNAMWQVLGVQIKALGFPTSIVNVTYGELLTGRDLRRRFYMDLLTILSLFMALALTLIFYEPYIVYFLRPQEYSFIGYLRIPVVLGVAASLIGVLNQYYSWVMQGVDRVDFNGEVKASTYVGSLVFYAHLAELIFTAIYLALAYPLILAMKAINAPTPIITGVLASSIVAGIVSLLTRALQFRGRYRGLFEVRLILTDLILPLTMASVLTYFESKYLLMLLPPVKGAWPEVARIALAFIATALTYFSISIATSSNLRRIARLLVGYVSSALGGRFI